MPFFWTRWNGKYATSRLHGGKKGKASRRAANRRARAARKGR